MVRIRAPYALGKKRIRMSWNKYNMYNQTQVPSLKDTGADTISLMRYGQYGERLVSKRISRQYHGQGLAERVFKKQLYNPRFNVVAGGRPGRETLIWGGLYHGVERRLDTVIFRSLFATSIQQARQLVLHGHVEVNGKRESRPGLSLRPGDIYHANPQLVRKFLSTESPKQVIEREEGFKQQRAQYLQKTRAAQGNTEGILSQAPTRPALSARFELDPYTPIERQLSHPIFKLLDKEAQEEEEEFQKYHRFIPKPFMAPNVFLPAYLEVSYRSCTGCFVRLPQIKKDGLMDIPSPYPPAVHERAAMFYARYGHGKERRQTGYRGYRLFAHKRKSGG